MAMPTTAAEIRAKQLPPDKVDPNVKIPQQILDAGKRSEAIQHAIAGTAEPSVAAQLEDTQSPPDNTQSPPQAPPETTPPQQDDQSWEHKFRAFRGARTPS